MTAGIKSDPCVQGHFCLQRKGKQKLAPGYSRAEVEKQTTGPFYIMSSKGSIGRYLAAVKYI